MRKLAFPALVAAALAVTGCARQADDANATALNDADGANLSATDSLDGNATDSTATETSANAL